MKLALDGGGDAIVTRSDGASAAFDCSKPFPPGSTVRGRANGADDLYQLKVRNCIRKPGTERFDVDGRLVNLSKAQRARLLASLAGS